MLGDDSDEKVRGGGGNWFVEERNRRGRGQFVHQDSGSEPASSLTIPGPQRAAHLLTPKVEWSSWKMQGGRSKQYGWTRDDTSQGFASQRRPDRGSGVEFAHASVLADRCLGAGRRRQTVVQNALGCTSFIFPTKMKRSKAG